MEQFNYKLTDQQFKEAILFLFVELNANTLAMHEHFLKFYADEEDPEDYKKLKLEAKAHREFFLRQILSNLFGSYGDVDLDSLKK